MQTPKQAMEIRNLQQNTEVNGSVSNQEFFVDNKDIAKKKERKARKERKSKTPYSPTKIKARNFLSNIAYSRICDGDFSNMSFVANALVYITMDLKPFFLKMTYFDPEDIEMVKMLWEMCLLDSYLNYLKKPENFELPYSEKITFKQVKDIVGQYICIPQCWRELSACFKQKHVILQYVYSHLFPKTYANKLGCQKKIQFRRCLASWNEKKKMQSPITKEIDIYDDLEFKADVVDTKTKKPTAGNEAELPYSAADPPAASERFLYAPTMVGIKSFDKKYKLPKQKKPKKTSEEIQAENFKLEEKLAENTQSTNSLKLGTANLKKTIKKKIL